MSKEYENSRKPKKDTSLQNKVRNKEMFMLQVAGYKLEDISQRYEINVGTASRAIAAFKTNNKIEAQSIIDFMNKKDSEKIQLDRDKKTQRDKIFQKSRNIILKKLDYYEDLPASELDKTSIEAVTKMFNAELQAEKNEKELRDKLSIDINVNQPDLSKILKINEFEDNR